MAAGAVDEDLYLYGDQGYPQPSHCLLCQHNYFLFYVVLESPEDRKEKTVAPITENGTERCVV